MKETNSVAQDGRGRRKKGEWIDGIITAKGNADSTRTESQQGKWNNTAKIVKYVLNELKIKMKKEKWIGELKMKTEQSKERTERENETGRQTEVETRGLETAGCGSVQRKERKDKMKTRGRMKEKK